MLVAIIQLVAGFVLLVWGADRLVAGASAALHKACDLASKLTQRGHRVRAVLTPRAAELVSPQLFEAVTGGVPFQAESDAAIALARLREPVPRCRERRAGIPVGLDEAIHRAMAIDPTKRFETASSMCRIRAVRSLPRESVSL